MDYAITRRAALTRFAALVAGMAAGSWSVASSAQATAVPAAGFTLRRQQIFDALVQVYDGHGPIAAAGRDLGGEMANRYGKADPEYKTWIEALLDAVDSAPAGVPFADLPVADRRQTVHEWIHQSEPDDAILYRPRPSDARLPTDLRASNSIQVRAIATIRDALPPGALDLDPGTGLPKHKFPRPSMPTVPTGSAVSTPVRLRRYLCHSSYVLVASFFVDDTRYLTHEASV